MKLKDFVKHDQPSIADSNRLTELKTMYRKLGELRYGAYLDTEEASSAGMTELAEAHKAAFNAYDDAWNKVSAEMAAIGA